MTTRRPSFSPAPWPKGYYNAEFVVSTAYENGQTIKFQQYDKAGYIKFEQYDDAGYKPFSLDDLTGAQNFLEWYSLDGTALAANGRKVSCHGTHYFYGTFKMDDLGWPALGDSASDSVLYQRPCILQYDLDTEKWTALADYMRVPDVSAPPDVFRCPVLEKSSLGVDSKGVAYVFTAETAKTSALAMQSKDFRHVRGQNAVVKKVVVYKDKPYYFRRTDLWSDSGTYYRNSLQGLTQAKTIDPNAALGEQRPGVTARVLESSPKLELDPQVEVEIDSSAEATPRPRSSASGLAGGPLQTAQVRPPETLEYGFQAKGRDVTSLGDSLIAATYIRRSVPNTESEELVTVGPWKDSIKSRFILTFTHFDGEHWQVWPSGPDDLLRTPVKDKEAELIDLRGATGKQLILDPKNLAMGRYDSGFKVGGRFTVLAAGKGSGPSEKKVIE